MTWQVAWIRDLDRVRLQLHEVAPRLARPPRRSLDRLVPWVPPESWRPSPEAPANIPGPP